MDKKKPRQTVSQIEIRCPNCSNGGYAMLTNEEIFKDIKMDSWCRVCKKIVKWGIHKAD